MPGVDTPQLTHTPCREQRRRGAQIQTRRASSVSRALIRARIWQREHPAEPVQVRGAAGPVGKFLILAHNPRRN